MSATTPLTAMKLAEVVADAGLPAGVVNIVTGAGETGASIVSHPGVDKIAFTGSTEVGRIIQRALAGSRKKYTLELGGKAANIIFEDAAIDQAVEGIVNGIFFNQGHVCCAGSRLFVQESVAEQVIRKLKDRMETLIVGDPLDKNTDVGAIHSRQQLDKIEVLSVAPLIAEALGAVFDEEGGEGEGVAVDDPQQLALGGAEVGGERRDRLADDLFHRLGCRRLRLHDRRRFRLERPPERLRMPLVDRRQPGVPHRRSGLRNQ